MSALSFSLSIEGIVRHLENASVRDRLVGLYSRNYSFFFEEWLPREMKRDERMKGRIAFAVLDVDGLKRVNGKNGHAAGDRLLERLARAAPGNIRGGDIAARFGGAGFFLGPFLALVLRSQG